MLTKLPFLSERFFYILFMLFDTKSDFEFISCYHEISWYYMCFDIYKNESFTVYYTSKNFRTKVHGFGCVSHRAWQFHAKMSFFNLFFCSFLFLKFLSFTVKISKYGFRCKIFLWFLENFLKLISNARVWKIAIKI